MNPSRSILAVASLSLGLAVVVACSSAPEGEGTGTSLSQDLFTPHCPIGQVPSCKGSTCTCVPAPPQCIAGKSPGGVYISAWAVLPIGGSCPVVSGNGGVWADIGMTPAGFVPLVGSKSGVPNDPEQNAPSCTEVYTPSCFSPCCTYVWWPYVTANPDDEAPQDSASLTSGVSNPSSMVSLWAPWSQCPSGTCKGGDDCPTCEGERR